MAAVVTCVVDDHVLREDLELRSDHAFHLVHGGVEREVDVHALLVWQGDLESRHSGMVSEGARAEVDSTRSTIRCSLSWYSLGILARCPRISACIISAVFPVIYIFLASLMNQRFRFFPAITKPIRGPLVMVISVVPHRGSPIFSHFPCSTIAALLPYAVRQ